MKPITSLLITSLIAGIAAPAVANTDLTVYTAFEPEQLAELKSAFEQQHPDINIKWVRDSTGVVTARLLAEKAQPKADAVWGLAATSLMQLDQQQMLAGYAPKGLEKLDSRFRDDKAQPHWIGLDAFFSAICFNEVEAKKQGIPAPESWADLTKPIYKGKVIMPNPSSSGTGFLSVAGWLQTMGEQQGWQFMNDLHQNISRYTHSGSAPCKLAASGETVVGISFDFPAASLKAKGAPIEVIFPKEGSGWDMEAAAIIKGTSKLQAAQQLLDFAATEQANRLYNKSFAVVAIPQVAQARPGYPADINSQMIKNDFAWAARERDNILTRWNSNFSGKTEAKK
ncbi:putative 2-aminoethylphosphonate ABC transporter substrate-binding protein [Serratia sp. DD3]|uniref:putative 2-aminoethylphosphonate ABC transporter substrate-binding protein n=1 Tax=Serratia sp. DD3 TaxID=1410619 RepID=UPI0003C4E108|nr:putative 2-aminoethylphosphonate ABC transporter substrate-binding protein [Serratia sp. DD3]KEY56489.1 2-aminoethylphosphonate ABC transporter substrate-binding protein [Serratia sp. DD3]KEY56709.1 2-aminoethylphosphonate ABC transporter substrate-binding protein [Serratia sp. DD3]KEY58358.1 2-aminoethylphosphonate ABC transporter substrate-binding protein [Serratia sp. DD3]KEY59420.1 2-aminoethylphosphonate ABC transporter substrate-binding protein [Serratia sp. DD3]